MTGRKFRVRHEECTPRSNSRYQYLTQISNVSSTSSSECCLMDAIGDWPALASLGSSSGHLSS